jgi:hypothetical protein
MVEAGLQARARALVDLVEFVLGEPCAKGLAPRPALGVVGVQNPHDRSLSGFDRAADGDPFFPCLVAFQRTPRLAASGDKGLRIGVELDRGWAVVVIRRIGGCCARKTLPMQIVHGCVADW